MKTKIAECMHPDYTSGSYDWEVWRNTYDSGRTFIDNYLTRYSRRERAEDYNERRKLTYVPSFAALGIDRIRNAIYSRLGQVRRDGGSVAYQKATKGDDGGIDRLRSSMSTFIGMYVLPELLSMQKVGIYVDRPEGDPMTKADEIGKNCYCYIYRREDVRSWACDESSKEGYFKTLLLRDWVYEQNEYGLDSKLVANFRLLQKTDSGINVKFFDAESKQIGEKVLNLKEIPFVFPSLQQSMLRDVARYQIALMNLASADMIYALKANFPFYVEQYDTKSDQSYRKTAPQPAIAQSDLETQGFGLVEVPATYPGEQTQAKTSAQADIVVGVQSGRRYSTDKAPQFIHPSPEPMLASMDKQKFMTQEIDKLLHLAIENQNQIVAIKNEDGSTIEVVLNGLSYIGHVLQTAEQEIANIIAMYEGTKEPAKVIYPVQYTLKSDSEIIEDAEKLQITAQGIPSKTYKQEVAKQVATMTVGTKIPEGVLKTIYDELETAPNMVADPKSIETDVNLGLVSLETASLSRGWAAGEAAKAAVDHAERLARIAASQSAINASKNPEARGTPDLGANPQGAKEEKKESQDPKTQRDIKSKLTRGENK